MSMLFRSKLNKFEVHKEAVSSGAASERIFANKSEMSRMYSSML